MDEMNQRRLRTLSDPTRLQIVEFLASSCCHRASLDAAGRVYGPSGGEICCHVTGAAKISSTVSHHLHDLETSGLIDIQRDGKKMVCTLRPEALLSLAEFLGNLARGALPAAGRKEAERKEGNEMNPNEKLTDRADVRQIVREKYGAAALRVLQGNESTCCGGHAGGGREGVERGGGAVTGGLYSDAEISQIPETAILASLGCGNPTALTTLVEGEVVLDLGSGGGIDVLLSARRVGPTGFAYGVDMTDEMLQLAEKNKQEAGVENLKFLKGQIESAPLPDESVDVVISNCVINLSSDKDAVLREAFRVLRPGGRLAISDIVTDGEIPDAVRGDMQAYVGCVAGALERDDYLCRLRTAGFIDASIEFVRKYLFADLEATTCCSSNIAKLPPEERAALDGRIVSGFIRATKPAL